MKVDYDKIYSEYSNEQEDYVRHTVLWKAKNLCGLIKDEPAESILDVGTGRGEVLDACYPFKIKIGADISEEALKQHREKYNTHKLVKIDADKPLPFKNNEIDFVLLCDILEHVDNPVNLLKEAARVGKNVLLKMPVEKALLLNIMRKVYKIEYGPKHPSGHLHCWNLPDVQNLITHAGVTIVRSKFIPTSVDLLKRKNLLHNTAVRIVSLVNHLTADNFLSRTLIGGSLFVIAHR